MSLKQPPTQDCRKRLQKDAEQIHLHPHPNFVSRPIESDITTWYFVFHSMKDTLYTGYYLGKIVFPYNYPYKPPALYMLTPNGRFQVNTRLCLSMSDYHPESWNPFWSVSTVLQGFLSFMQEEQSTYGSIICSTQKRKQFALESLEWNLRQPIFCELFPELVEKLKEELNERESKKQKKTVQQATTNVQGVQSLSLSKEPVSWWKYFQLLLTFLLAAGVVFFISK